MSLAPHSAQKFAWAEIGEPARSADGGRRRAARDAEFGRLGERGQASSNTASLLTIALDSLLTGTGGSYPWPCRASSTSIGPRRHSLCPGNLHDFVPLSRKRRYGATEKVDDGVAEYIVAVTRNHVAAAFLTSM